MTCHQAVKKDSPEIAKLALLGKSEKVAPPAPVYQVPDFVFFSHARHGKAAVSCDTCHGTVTAKDTVEREVNLKMKFCVDCHKANSATIACNACHELNQ
jgi:hypothetical protein